MIEKLVTVIFEPISKRIKVPAGITVLNAASSVGDLIKSYCGGRGTCGKCKVVLNNQVNESTPVLTPLTRIERDLLTNKEISEGFRLACQAEILSDARILIPLESRRLQHKILVDSMVEELVILPSVVQVQVSLERKEIMGYKSILQSITSKTKAILVERGYFKEDVEIKWDLEFLVGDFPTLDTIRRTLLVMAYIFPGGSKCINVKILEIKDINVEGDAASHARDYYGIAFDIGTTTVVGYLHELHAGKLMGIESELNPQITYGEDVISRIQSAMEPPARKDLQDLILNCLKMLLARCCEKSDISPLDVYEITIVGNTAMNHLFLGINPKSLGLAPYVPVIHEPLTFRSNRFNFNANPRAFVHVLPNIGGYVGSDTVGNILTTRIYEKDEFTLIIDIGTNGELVIGNKEHLIVGSCAAGSAMEGAHVKFGMRGAAGAIEQVSIDPGTYEISYKVIGEIAPLGFCGSGFIDAIAEMLRAKIITRSGKFNKELVDDPRLFRKEGDELAFILVDKESSSIDQDIVITQNDVRELQKAKSAFSAGIKLLLDNVGKTYSDLEQVLLAGAFGNYINPRNAKFIGLIPDIEDDLIFQIGNAAGRGCEKALLNINEKRVAERILDEIQYLELTTQDGFEHAYAMAMYFPHYNLEEAYPTLKKSYEGIPTR
ncbi:MAG: ASKHA domain-containing protein [Candidatus Hodarchaeota archaeon]